MAIFISPLQRYYQQPFSASCCDSSISDEDLLSLLQLINYPSLFSTRSFCRKTPKNLFNSHINCQSKVDKKCCEKDKCNSVDQQKTKDSINKELQPFHHTFDVKDFHPSELKVRVKNGGVEIIGNSSKREEGYYSGRQLWRRIELPEMISPDDIQSSIDDDGILTITTKKVERNRCIDKKESCSIEKTSDDGCCDGNEKSDDDCSKVNKKPDDDCCEGNEKKNDGDCCDGNKKPDDDYCEGNKKDIVENSEEKIDRKVNFHQTVDVKDFNVGDITVQIKNNNILVSGSTIIEDDGIKCSKKIWRIFPKPENIKDEDIVSNLDDNGILTITTKTKEIENVKVENSESVKSEDVKEKEDADNELNKEVEKSKEKQVEIRKDED